MLRFFKHKNVHETLSNRENCAVKTEEKATQTEETMVKRWDFALLVKELEKTRTKGAKIQYFTAKEKHIFRHSIDGSDR